MQWNGQICLAVSLILMRAKSFYRAIPATSLTHTFLPFKERKGWNLIIRQRLSCYLLSQSGNSLSRLPVGQSSWATLSCGARSWYCKMTTRATATFGAACCLVCRQRLFTREQKRREASSTYLKLELGFWFRFRFWFKSELMKALLDSLGIVITSSHVVGFASKFYLLNLEFPQCLSSLLVFNKDNVLHMLSWSFLPDT